MLRYKENIFKNTEIVFCAKCLKSRATFRFGAQVTFSLGTDVNTPFFPRYSHQNLGKVPGYNVQ